MTINERIREIRKAAGLTQQALAEALGVSASNIVSYEAGRRNPSDAVVELIVQKFHVSEAWLRTGEGDMQTPTARIDGVRRMVDDIAANSDSFKARLISALSDLPVEDWEKIEAFARQIVEEGTEELLAAHMREGFTADSPEALADIEMIKRIDSGETD